MAETDRRPTSEEIEDLVELVRRDPSSPAFVDLGEAYLALGRPRDALEAGAHGLGASPESVEGRVMISRALVALHQWKEAQAELLRVVKTDRGNRRGFALLGEVLLRRSDFERALPVLQHAQNLDPANPDVLAMLKRARSSQPLDPPPPIPTPIAPATRSKGSGASAPPAPSAPSSGASSSSGALSSGASSSGASPGGPPRPPARSAPPPPRKPDPMRGDPTELSPPPNMDEPVRGRLPLAAAPTDSVPSVHGGTAPRPRIAPAARPVNAAAESLRRSAAVGETFLNDLLTGGLLDVPGVAVPDVDFDIRPDRRWGRSTSRMFVVLFIALFVGVGGGAGWYLWTKHARAEAIARHRAKADEVMRTASWDGLTQALNELRSALESDKTSALTMAEIAEVAGLETLLYGTDPAPVDEAIKGASRDIKQPDQDGYRELVIARAAVALSRLSTLEAPVTRLTEVRAELEAWLKDHPDDRWAEWLRARAMLAAGERAAAHAALQRAADGKDGAVVAMIDRADLLADEGKYDEAVKLHEDALKRVADHPLAVLGRTLARAERGVDAASVMDDLNVKLDKPLGPRVAAYRHLAQALAHYALEDYVRFHEALAEAKGPTDARFLARVALADILDGALGAAAKARSGIAWYGKNKPEPDPMVALVDAALSLAAGLPDKVLDTAKGDSLRAMLLRGQALLDLGRAKDAVAELDRAATEAPDSIEAQILREQARALASSGKDRANALDALEKVARRAKTKLGRHALGAALYATGASPAEAHKRLEQAVEDVSEEAPNPVAYRTRTLLAEMDLAAGNLDAAATQIEAATKANPGYLPALALRARVALAKGDPDGALDLLAPVIKEKLALSAALELTLAEALIRHKEATDQDRQDAVAALERARTAGAPLAEIGRVAFLIDPALPEKLGAPVPKDEAGDKDKHRDKDRGKPKRRGR